MKIWRFSQQEMHNIALLWTVFKGMKSFKDVNVYFGCVIDGQAPDIRQVALGAQLPWQHVTHYTLFTPNCDHEYCDQIFFFFRNGLS